MYCKNCGRQLKEGMRYCDRCGQSVRKNRESSRDARQREIEELKAERLNRKKRLAEKEAKQARSKERIKSKSHAFIFVIIIVLIAAASVLIGYNMFPDNNTESAAVNTAAPSAVVASPVPSASPSAGGQSLKDGYSQVTVANITCPYPSSFRSNTTSGSEKINLTDTLGGAGMIIAQDTKIGEPKDMMKEYMAQIGATGDPEMHAASEWYSITAEVNGKVYHRKCIVRNGLSVYYDFTYDAASTAASKYKDYINYIDANFN